MLVTIVALIGLLLPGLSLDGIRVHHAPRQVGNLWGVACHQDFRALEGNAQALCAGQPDGTIVVYPAATTDERTYRETLAHEAWHLNHRACLCEERAYGYGRAPGVRTAGGEGLTPSLSSSPR